MTDPTPNYPVPPPPPTSPWTTQDPYAPYAGPASHPRYGRADRGRPGAGAAVPALRRRTGGRPALLRHCPGRAALRRRSRLHRARLRQPVRHAAAGTQKPPAYWPLSIVGLLFSFLFGAIAIYFSVQVGRRWNRGDVDGSRRASRTARTLGIIAIIVGVIGTAILLAADR